MPKTKLSDSQLVILSATAKAERPIGREDLERLKAKGAVLTRAVKGLITRGMLEEVSARLGKGWRQDEALGLLGLRITTKGYQTLGIEPAEAVAKPGRAIKQDRLIAFLSGDGTTIAEIGESLGWLPHTVRAALTRLRQKGHDIERTREDGVSRYRITQRGAA